MGEVYRAKDTKLGREVAIKLLLEEVSADPERMARFEREARVLASLNHNNIATLHGFEKEGDTSFLVMELVEGETLADRINRGAIPVEEVLPLFLQIAEGLEAAHEKGVIHRDLKPANIKVSDNGNVKILDFGLAKAMAPEADDSGNASVSMSPTLTLAATQRGEILGTAAYMSPEQARGAAVDRRTDVWAFGACLYESLTAASPFDADSGPDSMAKVLQVEPDWQRLPRDTPARIRELVERCLVKSPRDRLHDIADARIEIETAIAKPAASAEPGSLAGPVAQSKRMLWAAATLLVGAALASVGWWQLGPSEPDAPLPPLRFVIDVAAGTYLPPGSGSNLAISNDGQTLVYVASDTSDTSRLYVRRLGELRHTPIAGTERAGQPFFSPDGLWVGFNVDSVITKKVLLSGGEPFTLCQGCGSNGVWGEDGNILYAQDGSLWRIPEVGGTPELVAEPTPELGVSGFSSPVLLPGGKAILFQDGEGAGFVSSGIAVLSLDTDEVVRISDQGTDPIYSSTGHILFPQGNTLFAVAFDIERFEVQGQPVPVLQGVRVENGGALQAVVSPDGLLVYRAGGSGTQLVWADREGRVESVIEPWRVFYGPRLSPDGEKIAVQITTGGKHDIWIREVASGTLRPLTTTGNASNPIWTPDGAQVTFSESSEGFVIQSVPADGSGSAETVISSEYPIWPEAWLPDGRQLVFRQDSQSSSDLFVVDAGGGGSATPLLASEFSEHSAALSHNGDWLAYVSNRSGGDEVWVRPFPGPGGEHVVSLGGGGGPVWSRDSTEIYYRVDGTGLTVARLQTEPFQILSRERLFNVSDFWGGAITLRRHYDVGLDGERFLMLSMKGTDEDRTRIHVVLNWFEELKRLMPTD